MSHAHWLAASEGAHVLATPLSGGDCSALLEHRRAGPRLPRNEWPGATFHLRAAFVFARPPSRRICSSSGKGPRGKTESLARCLSPPRACPPLAGGLVAVVVPRVRRADCPLSSGCCVTAPAAYPPRAPEWSTAALCGGRKLQRSTLAACFRLCRPLLLSRDFRGA